MIITREDYISSRKRNDISVGMCYEYYLAKCENPLVRDPNTFRKAFSMFLPYLDDFTEVTKYLDQKFNVNILRNKEGEIIKIY